MDPYPDLHGELCLDPGPQKMNADPKTLVGGVWFLVVAQVMRSPVPVSANCLLLCNKWMDGIGSLDGIGKTTVHPGDGFAKEAE
jgi:hypothetical protein